MNSHFALPFLLLSITLITTSAIQQPLPPPQSSVALAFESPVDHLWKVLTFKANGTIQVAPHSPLLIYINTSITVSLVINSAESIELNGTGNWTVLINDLGEARFYTIRVSARNATITLYVLSAAEEVQLAARSQPPAVDPFRVKRVWAVTAAVTAVLAGVPLGYLIKRKTVEKRLKKVPYEEL